MYCAKCGKQLSANDRWCPSCGTPTQHGAPVSAPANVPAHVPTNTQTNVPASAPDPNGAIALTFIEDGTEIAQTTVELSQNRTIHFGSATDNDVVVQPQSRTVSGHHGTITVNNGWCSITDNNSLNGLFLNGVKQQAFRVMPGDVVSVGKPERGSRRCVIVVSHAQTNWEIFSLQGKPTYYIGRNDDNDLVLPEVTVSAHHALLTRNNSGWYIQDLGSTNGTQLNGIFVRGMQELYSGSMLSFGNQQTVFLDDCLLVTTERHGVDVVASELVRYRKNGSTTRITTDHVCLNIKRGEFVAIVGGSGCGKSTLLNELSGEEPADEGSVFVGGTDLYANYEMLKTSVGYVPQQDIVYDNLTLYDMLVSAAKLRMQPDISRDERAARIEEVIHMLELDGVRNNMIGRLSGGQKKRASIAVELMADPRLLFLDEPTSGLDPGIERKLMQTLAKMAHDGRTIILVTHTTLNLHLCDQVVFLGQGGKLCFAGRPTDALSFFGVTDYVDIYNKVEQDGEGWQQRFKAQNPATFASSTQTPSADQIEKRAVPSFFTQLKTLTGRYTKLLANDRSRMLLLLLQAPLLGALISFVAGSDCFKVFEDTKSCLFALSCAAFWVGILNAIQEICKERAIAHRDYNGGVRIGAYLQSKVLVLGLVSLIQSFLLTFTFCAITGLPSHQLFNSPLEFFLTLYLTTLSAMSLGLLVSSLFKNPDRAIAMAPLLIMPQILFSGLVFELSGPSESISYVVTCRWAMEALGTTADLNSLDLALYGEEVTVPSSNETLHDQEIEVPKTEVDVDTKMGPMTVEVPAEKRTFETLEVTVPEMTKTLDNTMFEHEQEDMFQYSLAHLLRSWGILLGKTILCIVACHVLLFFGLRKE